MRKVKVLTASEAAMLVKDGDSVATGGFVGSGSPETLSKAIEARFLETGSPKNLTYIYAAGQGNRDGRGSDHSCKKSNRRSLEHGSEAWPACF